MGPADHGDETDAVLFFFRFAKYYKTPDGAETRTLIKAYGIRFDIIVFGTVRERFNLFTALIPLSSTCVRSLRDPFASS